MGYLYLFYRQYRQYRPSLARRNVAQHLPLRDARGNFTQSTRHCTSSERPLSDAAYWPRAPAGKGCEWKSHRRRGVHCAAATLRHRPCNLPITASRRVASPAHRTCLDLTRRYDTDNARSL